VSRAQKQTRKEVPEIAAKKTEDGGQRPEGGTPGGETPKDQPKGEGVEAGAAELKSCDLRPTAEEMFGRFMVAVAGRPLSVHQPVNEIGDTAGASLIMFFSCLYWGLSCCPKKG